MAAQDIPNTAIITLFCLPFGLKNAAKAIQSLIDGILRKVNFAFVYLDDILVASGNEDSHKSHLRQLLTFLEPRHFYEP